MAPGGAVFQHPGLGWMRARYGDGAAPNGSPNPISVRTFGGRDTIQVNEVLPLGTNPAVSPGSILEGGDDDDIIHGTQTGPDLLIGGAGRDRLLGYGGNDTRELQGVPAAGRKPSPAPASG